MNPSAFAQQTGMAQQQQQQQQQQWAGAQPIYASPAAFNPATSSYPGSNGISAPQTPVQGQQYGGGAPYQGGGQPGAPSYPPQQQQQQQQTPNNMHEAQQAALRGMNLQGLTPEKWASLPPQQQQMLRQMLQARQQSALGMGYPASPAGGQGGMPNGSPTPMGGAGSPVGPAPGGYQQGGARPPSQGQPPNTPQGQGQQPSPATSGFLKTLSDFYAKRGQPFPGQPVIDGRTVDLSILYQLVIRGGGFQQCHQQQLWRQILGALGFPIDPATGQQPDSRVHQLAQNYYSLLLPFETMFVALRKAQQQQQAAALAAQGGQRPGSAAGPAPSPANSTVAPSPLPNSAFTPQTPSQPLPQPPRQASFGQPTIPTNIAGATPFASAQSQQSPMQNSAPPLPDVQQQQQQQQSSMMGGLRGEASRSVSATPIPIPVPTPPTPVGEDQRGKARDMGLGTKRAADESSTPHTNGATPVPDIPSANADAPTSTAAVDDVKPQEPAVPARRKRQKITYMPLQRNVDTYAGWDLGQMEDMMAAASKRRPARQAMDLGLVDIHSLTMSIRSRLGTEVAFALNSLTLISVAMRTVPTETTSIPFPLAACGALLDELVDLLEESAFGVDDDWEDEVEVDEVKPNGSEGATDDPSARSYRDLFRLVTQEETELADVPRGELKKTTSLVDDGLPPLGPVEICLALTNLFRNLSISDENAHYMASKRRVLEVLVKVAGLPLRRDGAGSSRWPIRVSAADSMALKKDVLETVSHFGLKVDLEQHSTATAGGLFHLLTFFLVDADHHEQLYFDLSSSPSYASRLPQPGPARLSHYLELGLAAFARITLPDANRYIVSQLSTSVDLFALFESLVHHLPVSESDFQLVTSEPGLVVVENLAMSLYNLAFLAPVPLKLRLRAVPAFVKGLLRVVRRLAGTSSDPIANAFLTLSDRCIATLQVLSDLSGVAGKREQEDTPWWGLSMGGEEEDRPTSCQPTEADRSTIRQRHPPKASDGSELGPPILAGETSTLFQSLLSGSLPVVFGTLTGMMDATSEKQG